MLNETEKEYPKVLILCQNKIQPYTGGGVVLSNLFEVFPDDKLIFFHRDQDYGFDTPFQEYRCTWRWLRPKLGILFQLLHRWVADFVFRKKKVRWRDLPQLFLQSCYFKFPKKVDEVVKKFRPDVMYAWVGDSLWAKTVSHTADRYNLPYAIHFMDNHVGVKPETALECALYAAFRQGLDPTAQRAVLLYTISESMGASYKMLWNRPYEVFHGVIDTPKWPLPNPHLKSEDVFKIVFTGSIESGQLSGLKDAAKAVDQINQNGYKACLVLYTANHYLNIVRHDFEWFNCVEILPHPDFSSLRGELAKADLLILAYGFDLYTKSYYQHSFATKIVPYMLSGRPILVYGPAEIEPVAYAARGGWASVVNSAGVKYLQAEIEKLMNDPELRESLARSAWKAGRTEHDLAENSERFRRSLLSIARS